MIVSDWLSNNYIEVFGAITGVIYVFLEIRQSIWLWPLGIITSAVYIWVFFTSKFYADMSLQGYYLVISCLGWYWWKKGTGHRAQGTEHRAQGIEQRAQGTGQKAQGAGQKAKGTGHRAQGTEHRAEGVEHRAQDTENRTQGIEQEGEKRMGVGEEKKRNGDSENKTLQVTRLKLRTGVMLSFVFLVLYAMMWLVLSRLTDSPVPEWDSFITSLSIVATWMLARKIYEHWLLWIVVNSVSSVLFLTRGLYPTVILYIIYGIMSFSGLAAWKKSIRMV